MNTQTVGLSPDDAAPNETHDFHGFTAPPDAPGQAASVASKTALDAWAEEQAKETEPGRAVWMPLYQELLDEQTGKPQSARWDWRKCLYVAWRCAPATLRWPLTVDELARFMGLRNTATIRHWRLKDPTIEQRIADLRVYLVDRHVSDLLFASLDCALHQAEKGFQDRKMLLEIANVYKPKTTQEITGADGGPVRTLTELSDEDLERIAAGSR